MGEEDRESLEELASQLCDIQAAWKALDEEREALRERVQRRMEETARSEVEVAEGRIEYHERVSSRLDPEKVAEACERLDLDESTFRSQRRSEFVRTYPKNPEDHEDHEDPGDSGDADPTEEGEPKR